jgi:hypothetical protein
MTKDQSLSLGETVTQTATELSPIGKAILKLLSHASFI